MSASSTRRLAGISFITQPPQSPEKLPRMDIAVFVGFASAGPLNVPVMVEDATQFAAVFGDDLPLAWDDEKSELTYAYLAPAVRAFFRNGGQRCWVIRVADKPESNFFPLPGLARIDGDKLHPAFAQARSGGSWFDAFRAATALTVRAVGLLSWDSSWTTINCLLSRPDDLKAGDLLRVSFEGEDPEENIEKRIETEAFFLVTKVTSSDPSPPDVQRGHVAAQVESLGTVRWERVAEIATDSFELIWERADGTTSSAQANLTSASPPADAEEFDTIEVSGWLFARRQGRCWCSNCKAEHGTIFRSLESELSTQAGSPPSGVAQLVGRVFSWSDQPPDADAFLRREPNGSPSNCGSSGTRPMKFAWSIWGSRQRTHTLGMRCLPMPNFSPVFPTKITQTSRPFGRRRRAALSAGRR